MTPKNKHLSAVLDTRMRGNPVPKKPNYGRLLDQRGRGEYPSLMTMEGNGLKKETPSYTGQAMLGVATMHKSNQVPVFTPESALDIAKMRRG